MSQPACGHLLPPAFNLSTRAVGICNNPTVPPRPTPAHAASFSLSHPGFFPPSRGLSLPRLKRRLLPQPPLLEPALPQPSPFLQQATTIPSQTRDATFCSLLRGEKDEFRNNSLFFFTQAGEFYLAPVNINARAHSPTLPSSIRIHFG